MRWGWARYTITLLLAILSEKDHDWACGCVRRRFKQRLSLDNSITRATCART